jgi:hypothetical protein
MAKCTKPIVLSLALLTVWAAIAAHERYATEALAQSQIEDLLMQNQAVKVSSIYQGKEYSTLTPFFIKDGQKSVELGFPKLPDNIQPEMTIEEGQTLAMKFKDTPVRVYASLIDYDGDVPVKYPLDEISKNTFRITPEGIKTLEVQAIFPGNKQVHYSTLVDVV